MMRFACGALVSLIACGGAKPASVPTPAPQRPVITPVADASPATQPEPPAFTRESLPVWPPAPFDLHNPPEGETEVYAVDVDGDQLVMLLAVTPTLIAPATRQRLTGRLTTETPLEALWTVAAQLGVDPDPRHYYIRAASEADGIDIRLVAAPFADVIGAIADAGKLNVVLAPSSLPAFNFKVSNSPPDRILRALAFHLGLTLATSGTTHYVLAKDATLPPLSRHANAVVDLDAEQATVGQVVAALAGVAKLDVGSCSATKVRLKLRNVKLAEAIRAIEIASGEKLTKGVTCENVKPIGAQGPEDELRLVATAKNGTKRTFIHELRGTVLVAKRDMSMPAPHREAPTPEAWVATFKRTAAMVRSKRVPWTSIVETTTGWRIVVGRDTHPDDPKGVHLEGREDGVYIVRADGTVWKHLPLSPN